MNGVRGEAPLGQELPDGTQKRTGKLGQPGPPNGVGEQDCLWGIAPQFCRSCFVEQEEEKEALCWGQAHFGGSVSHPGSPLQQHLGGGSGGRKKVPTSYFMYS